MRRLGVALAVHIHRGECLLAVNVIVRPCHRTGISYVLCTASVTVSALDKNTNTIHVKSTPAL